jgi:predicted nucleic acid-binding protein
MPEKIYYFDTSIWLDFFEKRDEPNFPKSEWAVKLINKIVEEGCKILFSDMNMVELVGVGYNEFEIGEILENLKDIIIKVESTGKEIGKSKDLASKRDVPRGDALHSLIARDNGAILVTFDHDFRKLDDITKPFKTNELL